MKAVVLTRFGGPDTIALAETAAPLPAAGEVQVRILAAGLNPADWKLREGWLANGFVPRFPYVLGFDGAGIVTALGPGVSGLSPGYRVVVKTAVGRGGAGSLAEFATVPAALACPLPDGIGFIQAAALPTAGVTAWEALFEAGRIEAGQTLLVNGGAGGTGSLAIAIAHMAGARVAATARPKNHAYLSEIGADLALDYRRADLAAAVTAHVPGGVDLLVDTVGQGMLADPLGCIRNGGTLVTIGTLVRDEPRPPADEAARRGIRMITASSSREREAAQLRALVAALAEGRIVPPAIETLPLSRAAEAIERVRQGHVRGKLVLTLGAGDWA